MIKLLCVCFALSLATAGLAGANAGSTGTTAANFLSVGSGAGILGMGGATLGLGQGLNTLNWNVASLGWVDENELALSHATLADQTAQEWVAVGGRIRQSQTHWSVSGLYQNEGSFDGRDASNNPTGSFNVSSTALGLHVAQRFGANTTVGLGTKWVSENLGSASGGGLTFDAGAQYRVGMFGLGIAAQNAGGKMSYGSSSYSFPTNLGLGVAVDHPSGVRFALDANFPSSYYSDVRAGVEWRWRSLLALRAGYRKEMGAIYDDRLSGPSFGMGAGARGFWFDYGYLISGNGEGQHRIGLSFNPGSFMNAFNGNGLGSRALEPPAPAAPKPPRSAPLKPHVSEKKPAAEKKTANPGDSSSSSNATNSTPATAPPTPGTPPASTTPSSPATPTVVTPPASPAPPPAAQPPPAPSADTTTPVAPASTPEVRPDKVTVKSGETLASIARRWKVSVAAIMMENDMASDQVQAGQVLKLPRPYTPSH